MTTNIQNKNCIYSVQNESMYFKALNGKLYRHTEKRHLQNSNRYFFLKTILSASLIERIVPSLGKRHLYCDAYVVIFFLLSDNEMR